MTIIVVGGGVIGCAIAYELARRGADVRIVDTRGVGQGATRASAGMLAPQIEGHVDALRRLGLRSLALYDGFIARVVEDSGEAIEYARTGTLQVALDGREGDELCALAVTLADAEVAHTLLAGPDARRFEPQLPQSVTGALYVAEHGFVAAGPLTAALAVAAARRGASVISSHVLSLGSGDRPRVITAAGPLEADAVIVAAGAWAGALEHPADAPGHVKPVRGQLLELRLPTRPATRILWGSRCYIVPWQDGTVLVGATVEDAGFNEAATVAGVRQLLDAATELVPALAAATFQGVRVGLRPMTRDELPAIGPSTTMRRVFYATGHYRNGVLLAPLTASVMADLVLEGRAAPELAAVRPDRLGL